ncbi:CRAL/TRIO domain-containing protein [Calocera viscosa TUFC12733]|uniref:CRAL/TRIO domain-containing protein n=1 Tax=Calocera viscosa (strain TUFC12733) TaxID=1330018 RepID=A0A167SAI7_CALVF|nr:CRAL/TRIO domain-containing protein [Calocera viscosa TUFC12733]
MSISKVNMVLASADVMEGPQTKLTRQFTPAEWTALNEMKNLLPSIFEEAFPDNEKARIAPVTIWGVSVAPDCLDARSSVVLMHFLRAKKLKVEAARTMLLDTLRWRAEFAPEEAAKEPVDEAVFGKAAQMYGKDNEGRPVLYNIVGREVDFAKLFADTTKWIRWRVGLTERACLLLDFENVDELIHVYDLARSPSQSPECKQAIGEAGRIFRTHYPLLGFKAFGVNVVLPGLIRTICWFMRPFYPDRTLNKAIFIGGGPKAIGATLLRFIPASELPKPYGGTAEPKWATGPEWEDNRILRSARAK